MARVRLREIPPLGSKTYGFPIYLRCLGTLDWVSTSAAAEAKEDVAEETEEEQEQEGKGKASSTFVVPDPNQILVALGGGNVEGRSGVPDVLFIAEFDLISLSIPLRQVGHDWFVIELFFTGVQVETTVHAEGDDIVCLFPKNCKNGEAMAPRDPALFKYLRVPRLWRPRKTPPRRRRRKYKKDPPLLRP